MYQSAKNYSFLMKERRRLTDSCSKSFQGDWFLVFVSRMAFVSAHLNPAGAIREKRSTKRREFMPLFW